MTREDFMRNINDWGSLIRFCSEENLRFCENCLDSYEVDEYIHELITEWNDDDVHWTRILSRLDDVPRGYDYYYCDSSTTSDWYGLDDGDLDDYKEEVIEWADNNDFWEEEEMHDEINTDSNPEPEEELSPDDEPISDEDFNITGLFEACNQGLIQINLRTSAESEIRKNIFEV